MQPGSRRTCGEAHGWRAGAGTLDSITHTRTPRTPRHATHPFVVGEAVEPAEKLRQAHVRFCVEGQRWLFALILAPLP